MIVKTGLLILTNPINLRVILPTIHKQVQNTLYIHLTSAISDPPSSYKPERYTSPTKYSNTIRGIYADAAALCDNLDIRVLLSNLKNCGKTITTSQIIETVIFDSKQERSNIDAFVNNCVTNKIKDYNIWVWENECKSEDNCIPKSNQKVYKHIVLGGTFDRIHIGHKILLTEAILSAENKVTIGVTDTNMIKSKVLWELILPVQTRIDNLLNLTTDLCPELEYNIVPIQDPFGPTQSDPTMNEIIVSAETLRGGEKVNEIREQNGLKPLKINCIELLDSPNKEENEEAKVSSSNGRIRILGSLLQPAKVLPKKFPYIIGLTGGIASGKSSIAKRLEALGAVVVDCDKVAHEVYKPGTPCFNKIVETFGPQVVGENGEINRRVLGGIVFSDKSQMERLNQIVWPAIATEVQNTLSNINTEKIVILDAAVLLPAGWDAMCHEVWSCIIQPEEAVKRIQNRNNLSEEDAKKRISSQISNSEVVAKSNVVLCTQWAPNYTQKLVEKAWKELRLRLKQ